MFVENLKLVEIRVHVSEAQGKRELFNELYTTRGEI
jgi:hypothetical protein